jgi:hypothetical protein
VLRLHPDAHTYTRAYLLTEDAYQEGEGDLMSVATLTFTLPDERDEHYTAINAGRYRSVIYEMQMYLRNKLKYEELDEIEARVYQELREFIVAELDGLDV